MPSGFAKDGVGVEEGEYTLRCAEVDVDVVLELEEEEEEERG